MKENKPEGVKGSQPETGQTSSERSGERVERNGPERSSERIERNGPERSSERIERNGPERSDGRVERNESERPARTGMGHVASTALQDEAVIAALRLSLDQLDRTAPAIAPDVRVLERQLDIHRKTMRKRLLRELALFIFTAFALLAGLLSLYAQSSTLLLLVQIAAVTIMPYALLRMRRKRGDGS